eukprot:GHVU01078633.1.p2 GENE.GHVU01078633.1~~GHVU01078633.1.p2  ORF type:complete len:105 (-),score=1.09 GHVU01078633.1:1723-2037(-)
MDVEDIISSILMWRLFFMKPANRPYRNCQCTECSALHPAALSKACFDSMNTNFPREYNQHPDGIESQNTYAYRTTKNYMRPFRIPIRAGHVSASFDSHAGTGHA